MIFGVGVDLIEIKRVMEACSRDHFAARVYTENERREASSKRERLAGDFVVKEAVAKAFGTGFRSFGPADIEVLRDSLGKPYVKLHGAAAAFADAHAITAIHVSISDTKELVTAYAVAESNKAGIIET